MHKLVLCAQSEWFQKTCAGSWKVGAQYSTDHTVRLMTVQEGQESKIELAEDDPQVVDAMLHYLYNFDYGDYGIGQEHCPPIVLDVRVFAIAGKYFLANLKDLAAKKFETRAAEEWKGPGFVAAITEAYSIIPEHDDTIRKILVRIAREHASQLLDPEQDHGDLRAVAGEMSAFARDLATALACPHLSGSTYCCPGCDQLFLWDDSNSEEFGCPQGCYLEDRVWWLTYQRA